jgi:hypothetical protein
MQLISGSMLPMVDLNNNIPCRTSNAIHDLRYNKENQDEWTIEEPN